MFFRHPLYILVLCEWECQPSLNTSNVCKGFRNTLLNNNGNSLQFMMGQLFKKLNIVQNTPIHCKLILPYLSFVRHKPLLFSSKIIQLCYFVIPFVGWLAKDMNGTQDLRACKLFLNLYVTPELSVSLRNEKGG